MPNYAHVIGGAGTGKTTHLLKLMEWWLTEGFMTPYDIGFTSFTRAARAEASSRAASKFNIPAESLEQNGWFKTVHACCFAMIRAKSDLLLSDSKADRKWVSDAVGQEVKGLGEDSSETMIEKLAGKSDADRSLAMWDASRNRLVPIEDIWRQSRDCDEKTPGLAEVCRIIELYEQKKRLDGRYDFTDILGRYAGWAFSDKGHFEKAPEGLIPPVKIWFLDEQQDNSALTDAVSRRLVSESEWAYTVYDPFQTIFGFAGSESRHCQSWPITANHRRVLPQSYRCPKCIHELGEAILKDCSDYWDRGIAPAPHEGDIETAEMREPWAREIKPETRESWLLLARTNFHANRLSGRLDALGIPWLPVKGHGGKWAAPVRIKALNALRSLKLGHAIYAHEWQSIIKQLPACKVKGQEYLVRGTKTEWENYAGDPNDLIDLENLSNWGATDHLKNVVTSGQYKNLVDGAHDFEAAVQLYGLMSVLEPKVRVGTIHSAKGMEADNVVLLTTTSHQISKAIEDQSGEDEERRVWYVGVTRTRKKLLVVRENVDHRWELPL